MGPFLSYNRFFGTFAAVTKLAKTCELHRYAAITTSRTQGTDACIQEATRLRTPRATPTFSRRLACHFKGKLARTLGEASRVEVWYMSVLSWRSTSKRHTYDPLRPYAIGCHAIARYNLIVSCVDRVDFRCTYRREAYRSWQT